MERTFIGWRQSHGKPPKGPPAVNGPNRTGWIHAECSGFLPEAHAVHLQMSNKTLQLEMADVKTYSMNSSENEIREESC